MKQTLPLYLIASLLMVIILQNAGLLPVKEAASEMKAVVSILKQIDSNFSNTETGSIARPLKVINYNLSSIANSLSSLKSDLQDPEKPLPVSLENVNKYAFKWLKYSEEDAVPVLLRDTHSDAVDSLSARFQTYPMHVIINKE